MMKQAKIIVTEDFYNRKKGDVLIRPIDLASRLVTRGIAEYHSEEETTILPEATLVAPVIKSKKSKKNEKNN